MNLETAIAERDYRLDRYLEAQKMVDKLAREAVERAETERINRKVTGREVANLCGVSERTVYGWETSASTYKEWCEFLESHINGKYLKPFKKNYKRNKS